MKRWSANTIGRRRLLALVCWLALTLALNQLNWFGVQWWLEPDAEAAAYICHTTVVRLEHGLEAGYVGYTQHRHTQERLYLYSTIVVREAQCSQPHAPSETALTLLYRDVYLNVSHQDVDLEAERLRVLYPPGQAYRAWRYTRALFLFQFQPHQLDAHGFVMQPLRLDQSGWFVIAVYWLLKLTSVIVSSVGVTIAAHYLHYHHCNVDSIDE